MTYALVILCALVFLAACRVEPARPAAWGIVALDSATGQVGVAVAGCSAVPLDYRASVNPKHGAGIALGDMSPLQRDRLGAWIEQPDTASNIIARLQTLENDSQADTRQYAVVTLKDGALDTAVFTGADTAEPNAALQDPANAVVVAGTGLVSPDVAQKTLDAFRDSSVGSLTLTDRLMRGLEAGSQAGGVQPCNQDGITQTASSAFIMAARGTDVSFRTATQAEPASSEPNHPWLALSATETIGGRNALLDLRAQYDVWRSQNIPACADCNLAAITVPPGGNRTEPADAWLQANALLLVIGFIFIVALLTVLWFALRPHTGQALHAADLE